MEASLQSPIHNRTAAPIFERRKYIDRVKEALTPLDRSHGALQESVVLWGVTGIGKRAIAIQAAKEICAVDGRQLLVLNARTFGTLISSFTQAYIGFTGQSLSRSEHFLLNFYQFRLNLNRRRREWLMVVLDICSGTESFFDQVFPPFLPDRGQIIFTNTTTSSTNSANDLLSAICPTRLYVPPLSHKDVKEYARAQCPELLHMPKGGKGLLEPRQITLLDLNIITANMRLLDCSLRAYISYYSCRIRERAVATMSDLLMFTPSLIHREIFWDLLVEHSRFAGRLLAALTFMDPWAIPVAALQKLSMFKNTIADRLGPALELLSVMKIITIHDEHVSIQPALHISFRSILPRLCLKADWEALRLSWTNILRSAMSADPLKVFDYWSLGVHAWALSAFLGVTKNPPRLESLMFLTTAAKLPIFYIIYRHTLLDDALKLCGPLSSRTPDFTGEMYDYYVTKVRLARADDYLAGDVKLADAELQLAIPYVRYIENSFLYWKMKEIQWEIEARVLIAQEKFAQTETLLDYLFDRYPHSISLRTRKRLYHLMAVALAEQEKTVAALQYSHEAMLFFAHRYKPDGRPPRNRLAAEVVDTHIDLLIRMKKYRGALVYLIPSLEKMLVTLPQRPPVVLKYAKQALLCYAALRDLTNAERLVILILQANEDADCGTREDRKFVFADELADDCMPHYLSMLVHLCSLYFWHGRLVEAEGVMRYIIAVELQRVANDRPPLFIWFKDLLLFLYTQGNGAMFKLISFQMVDLHERTFPSEEIEKILFDYSKTKELYQRALWAAEDDCYAEWWKELLPEGTARSRFTLAEGLWGKAADRVRSARDFASDLDLRGIAAAKTSKILNLLGFDLVELAFASRLRPLRRATIKNAKGEETPVYPGLWPHVEEMPFRHEVPLDESEPAGRSRRASVSSITSGAGGQPDKSSPLLSRRGNASRADSGLCDDVDVPEVENSAARLQASPTLSGRPDVQMQTENAQDEPDLKIPRSGTMITRRRKTKESTESIFPGRVRAPIRLKGSSFASRPDVLNVIDLWTNHWHQRTLPEYWSWCYCRRHRKRSNSLNRIDLISKRFIREECEAADSAATAAKLIQKKITDSYILLSPDPKPLPRVCGPDCPCIAANTQIAEEWTEYNLNLATWSSDPKRQAPEPVGSKKWNTVATGRHPFHNHSSSHRFKRSRKPTPSLQPDSIFICLTRILASIEADPEAWDAAVLESREQDNHEPLAEALYVDEAAKQIPLGSSWKYLQAELTPMVERRDENYCMKHALEVPELVVTLTDDDWWLHGVAGRGRWFWRGVKAKDKIERLKKSFESTWTFEDDIVEYAWERVKFLDVVADDGQDRKAWVKWRKKNEYTGEEENWWVLTKRKELLTEYFEGGAFGPSQRIRAQRELARKVCPREPLQDIQEEHEDRYDEMRGGVGQQDGGLNASDMSPLMEAEGAPNAPEETLQLQRRDEDDEEDQAMAAFYRECWSKVAGPSQRPLKLSAIRRALLRRRGENAGNFGAPRN